MSGAPVGGQAVLEGVMMRGVTSWAVAVRALTREQLDAAAGAGLPRGAAALGVIEITQEPVDSVKDQLGSAVLLLARRGRAAHGVAQARERVVVLMETFSARKPMRIASPSATTPRNTGSRSIRWRSRTKKRPTASPMPATRVLATERPERGAADVVGLEVVA